MQNPFELIIEKLNRIEQLLNLIKNSKPPATNVKGRQILTIDQAAVYVCLSKSAIYKMTMGRTIPHFKIGKKLIFKRAELDEWMNDYRKLKKT